MFNHFTRRGFLGSTVSGLALMGLFRRAAAASTERSTGPAKRCVMLWMNGGPSQLETFDPKPGTSTGGPTKAISTSVAGIKLAEHFPQLAQRMDKHAVVRSVTSNEGDHGRAQYYLHTGFRLVPAFPRPALGSVLSHELPDTDAPKYVLLGSTGFGPAYCGPEHASFTIEDAGAARRLLGRIKQRQSDMEFLDQLGRDFDTRHPFPAIARRQSMLSRVQRMVNTPFREALDVSSESTSTRNRYGDHDFGARCLLARRLLERDVPFVEVQLDGWDTHVDNFTQVARLAAMLDQGWSALTDDLVAGGLWEDTLIVWMGDFGRTPVINANVGRDHFPAVTPVVMGGGVVRGGQTIGETNRTGTEIIGDPHRVADVAATVLQLLGIQPDQQFQTSFDSPTEATDDGKVIDALMA